MVIDLFHGRYVYTRRVQALSALLARLLPKGAKVLDVGCGDGLIAHRILAARPDLKVRGIDVLKRPFTHIPVGTFDGRRIPYPADAFDVVTAVDVLHHTEDPRSLLAEMARVSKKTLVIKDHLLDGVLAGPTLRFMDWVGNAQHGVALPYNYWPRAQWERGFSQLGLRVSDWEESLRLYSWPADLLFGRSLHFVAKLEKDKQ